MVDAKLQHAVLLHLHMTDMTQALWCMQLCGEIEATELQGI